MKRARCAANGRADGASLQEVQAKFLDALWNRGYPAAKMIARRAEAGPGVEPPSRGEGLRRPGLQADPGQPPVPRLGELKSMHTVEAARRHGVGRAMVDHVLRVAAVRGYSRVSLETGTMPYFAAARRLYEAAGFVVCEPFAEYTANPHSTCMSIAVDRSSLR